jgi:hypothetical protein
MHTGEQGMTVKLSAEALEKLCELITNPPAPTQALIEAFRKHGKQMPIKLYVDDEYPCPAGWVLARTFAEAIEHLERGNIESISLDHDLGEERTGYDIVCYIERLVHADAEYLPPAIVVHSANPVGREAIKRARTAIQRQLERR